MDNIYAPTAVEILEITRHTDAEQSFTLGVELQARPGQFVMVSLPNAGEVPIAISRLHDSSIEVTVRNVGCVTSQLFGLRPGDKLFLRGPYGQGFPLDVFEDRRLLVIAGGTGLTIMRPLIEYYLYNSDLPKLRQLDVLVGFRSPKHVLFKKDLNRWAKDCSAIVTVDTHEDDTESWAGGIGFVVDYIKAIKDIGRETFAVVAGPPLMMSNTVRELHNNGVLAERVWLSFERHMKCGVGKCGHCRIRDKYVCVDGPVFNNIEAKELID